ncbi:hypothetical protein A5697_26285 [Mycobacterium sp. E3251]|nr:hypothetical protein A5697_26285 [Mycobacterium sp. E3251]
MFVDSVDEALQVDPNIGYLLVRLVSHPGLDHIVWRLACRPSSWTVDLTEGLSTALPGFEELELLPLSVSELRMMAGADADDFLEAVEQAGLTHLLALPLHASNLLNDWRLSRQMPASRSVAMQHAVTRMLTETSNARLTVLDDQRRLLIAERLAAISMFCSVGSYALGSAQTATDGGIGSSSIPVNSVPTHIEPDLAGSPLTVTDIREVLGTALFTAAGHGAVAFSHQSYREFLAATYLVRRRVSGQRLVSVLGADVNGLVPGPMIEVLGWLLASGASVSDALIEDNAKELLSTTGLELLDDQARERMVDAILHGAANGTIDEGWRADTSGLSHPGLARQVRDAMAGASNPWVVFWICRIARQCAVHEAADDLLAIALDPAWSYPMRVEAVKAFAEVAPRSRMSELAPLLDLSPEQDPFDEILAATLRAVLPDAVDFARIRNALRPGRASNYIGAYRLLLRELPTLIPPDDVVPALTDALSRRPEHMDRAFDDLIAGLLRRAWEMRDPDVAEVVGAALGSDRLGSLQMFRGEDLPWQTDDDPGMRRAMAVAALAAHEQAFAAVHDLRMLTPSDLVWLIDWMPTAPPQALENAQIVLRLLAWNVADAETADYILAVDEDHPAYRELAAFQGYTGIASRPKWLRYHIESAEGPSETESRSKLRAAFIRARTNVDDWWRTVVLLASGDTQGLVSWDLKSRPLWSTLGAAEQDDLLRLGLDYLNARQPDVSRWAGRDQLPVDDVMPDWTAVFLLATLAAHHPDMLANVEPTAWESWAPVITLMPAYLSEGNWRRIRNAATQVGREAIDDALRRQVRDGVGSSFAHHPLADFSDNRLIAVVEQVARSTTESEDRRDEAIGVLVEHAPDVALDAARAALNDDIVPPAAFATVARLAPEELIAEWIAQDRLGPLEHLRDLNLDGLSDTSLGALAGMLLDKLPFAEDTDGSDDFADVTPESAARQMRMRLLQSMAVRGMSSSLAALRQGRPAAVQEHIRHLLQEARTREALANWQPLQPGTFMEVVASADARFVRDSAGLLRVLLEKLEEIQNDLRKRGTYRSLWDGEPGDNAGASPKGEDTISDWLVDQLRLRLQPHVVVDREIQVTRRKAAGIGTRIDITATSGGSQIGRVLFEAKRIDNRELQTAIGDQLVSRYMDPAGLRHGIYAVYWTAPALRPRSWHRKYPDADALAEELRVQAQRHRPRRYVEVVVLDIGPPD